MTVTIKPAPPSGFNKIAVIEFDLQADAWQASALFELSTQDNLGFGVLGAYRDDKLVGYLIYQSPLSSGIAEILRLGVAKSCQRQGIARLLMTAWLELDCVKTAESCLLEVRADNIPAIALYQAFGFTQIAVRKGYYKDKNGACDALILQRVNDTL